MPNQRHTTTRTRPRLFYRGDFASITAKKCLCVVELNADDIRSDYRLPCRVNEVDRHPSVTHREIQQFEESAIPPAGTVLITVLRTWQILLISVTKLTLKHRPLRPGDKVKRSPDDPLSGVVQKCAHSCTLRGLGWSNWKDHPKSYLTNWLELNDEQKAHLDTDKGYKFRDVWVCDLKLPGTYSKGQFAIYKGFLGRITETTNALSIDLYDGTRTERPDLEATVISAGEQLVSESHQIGDMVSVRRLDGYSSTAGSPEPAPISRTGVVAATGWLSMRVRWLYSPWKGQPAAHTLPQYFYSEDPPGSDFIPYDCRRRGEKRPRTPWSSDMIDSAIGLGHRVQFADGRERARYNSAEGYGVFNRKIEEDLGARESLVVTAMRSEVEVVWQDRSITRHKSQDLVPFMDERIIVDPGRIVCTHETHTNPPGDVSIRPKRVGVVQDVDPANLLARVRWCIKTDLVLLEAESGIEEERTRLSSSDTGRPGDLIEEVSLYDIYAPDALNPMIGDIIFLQPPKDVVGNDLATQEMLEHCLGEVVQSNLDGTYVVRLGLATEPREVEVFALDILSTHDLDHDADVHDHDHEDDDDNNHSDYTMNSTSASVYGSEEDQMLDEAPTLGTRRETHYSIDYEDGRHAEANPDDDDEDWDTDDHESMDGVEQIGLVAPLAPAVDVIELSPEPDVSVTQMDDVSTTHVSAAKSQSEKPTGSTPYNVLEGDVPIDHHFLDASQPIARAKAKVVYREHKMLRGNGALPHGIFVRSWESRMDLLRVLLVGPKGTPYAHGPFIFDVKLPADYPESPPQIYFKHWSSNIVRIPDRVNPNLYLDGKVCLSLLGTWDGDNSKSETWIPGQSTVLQVLVSILGLVLVKEPYYNEAGYDNMQDLSTTRFASTLYSEQAYLHTVNFMIVCLRALAARSPTGGVGGLEDVIQWLYHAGSGPKLLMHASYNCRMLLGYSTGADGSDPPIPSSLESISKGARPLLERLLDELELEEALP